MKNQQTELPTLVEIRNRASELDAKLWEVAAPIAGFSRYGYRKGTPEVLGRAKRQAARMANDQLVALLLACSDEVCLRLEQERC